MMKIVRTMVVALLFLVGAGDLYSQVLYRQTFGNNTGVDAMLTTLGIDWSMYRTLDGLDRTSTKTLVSGGAGNPVNLDDVNTGGSSLSQVNGFWFSNETSITYTTEYSVDLSAYTNLQFNWYQRNSYATNTMQVIVQIGGTWYISNQTFINADAATSFTSEAYTFSNLASDWKVLNFTPGSAITIGSAASSDLTGIITGFGLYSNNVTAGYNRFDTFTVSATAIPEPSTWVLLILGGSVLVGQGCFLKKKIWSDLYM